MNIDVIAKDFYAAFWPAFYIIWLICTSLWHFVEEVEGKLWRAFAVYSGADWPAKLSDTAGLLIFGLPVLALQLLAVIVGAGYGNQLALGALIGMRLSDSVFSHILPTLHTPIKNPGLLTGCAVYPVEALLLLNTATVDAKLVLGAFLGATVFAPLIPLLRLTSISNKP